MGGPKTSWPLHISSLLGPTFVRRENSKSYERMTSSQPSPIRYMVTHKIKWLFLSTSNFRSRQRKQQLIPYQAAYKVSLQLLGHLEQNIKEHVHILIAILGRQTTIGRALPFTAKWYQFQLTSILERYRNGLLHFGNTWVAIIYWIEI